MIILQSCREFDKNYFERDCGEPGAYKYMKLIERIYFPKSILDENIQSNSKVLDLGCAFGYFLKLCDGFGLKTYGLDISEYALGKAKKITQAKLYLHDANEGLAIFQNEFFDLVTMFDVIEHVRSPAKLLAEAFRVLKPGGKLIVTTPNLNAIMRFFKGSKWYGFNDKSHFYFFTPISLKSLIERNGFKITKFQTPFHVFPRFIQRIMNITGLGGQIWAVCQRPSQ